MRLALTAGQCATVVSAPDETVRFVCRTCIGGRPARNRIISVTLRKCGGSVAVFPQRQAVASRHDTGIATRPNGLVETNMQSPWRWRTNAAGCFVCSASIPGDGGDRRTFRQPRGPLRIPINQGFPGPGRHAAIIKSSAEGRTGWREPHGRPRACLTRAFA